MPVNSLHTISAKCQLTNSCTSDVQIWWHRHQEGKQTVSSHWGCDDLSLPNVITLPRTDSRDVNFVYTLSSCNTADVATTHDTDMRSHDTRMRTTGRMPACAWAVVRRQRSSDALQASHHLRCCRLSDAISLAGVLIHVDSAMPA